MTMPDQAPQTLTIEEILSNHDDLCEDQSKACGDCRRLKAALTALIERVIGEDEVPYSANDFEYKEAGRHRNKLRAEQRKRLANLIDKESER